MSPCAIRGHDSAQLPSELANRQTSRYDEVLIFCLPLAAAEIYDRECPTLKRLASEVVVFRRVACFPA